MECVANSTEGIYIWLPDALLYVQDNFVGHELRHLQAQGVLSIAR